MHGKVQREPARHSVVLGFLHTALQCRWSYG